MKISKKLSGVSRRDFFKVAGRYGLSSTVLGLGGLGGAVSLPTLAAAAESTYDNRPGRARKAAR